MSDLDEARRELVDDSLCDEPPKRSRPRHRKPYRDSVLTIPTTPERHALEELKIREAWKEAEIRGSRL